MAEKRGKKKGNRVDQLHSSSKIKLFFNKYLDIYKSILTNILDIYWIFLGIIDISLI